MSTHLISNFRYQFPALNIPCRQDYVETDIIHIDTPTIDFGHRRAQFYCGTDSQVCDLYGMKNDKQIINSFEDIIKQRGAIDILISDQAKVEISGRVLDLLRKYVSKNWNSEPHQQHQNHAEDKYRIIKQTTSCIMERSRSPAYCLLFAILYVRFIMNHTTTAKLQ